MTEWLDPWQATTLVVVVSWDEAFPGADTEPKALPLERCLPAPLRPEMGVHYDE